ncbi:MAG: hypothetical protein U9O94_00840 [Nanoarchaeota archaeon]|nr:hypothetical protein [Nanoarchaeota archaeon]
MIELLYFVVFILIAFSIGRRLLKLFKLKISFLEEFIFGVCLGYFILGYITFFLGISGLIYRSIFYVIVLLGLILSLFDIKYIVINLRKSYSNFKFGFNLQSILLIILLFFIVLNLVPLMGPVWKWDVTSYHFAAPKLYIAKHSIFFTPYINQTAYPLFTQMLYLFGMLVVNPILSKLIAYSFSILIVLAIISFSMRFFNFRVGLFGALIFFLMPRFMQSSVSAGSDISNALFSFMAFYSFVIWFKDLDIRWIILSAIMIGVALSTKYIAGIQLSIIFIFLLFRLITIKNKGIQYKLACLFLFSSIPFFIFSPWLIKSYIYTGNPVFPFLYSVFGGKYVSAANLANIVSAGKSLTVNLKNYLLLPWFLTMFPSKFPSIMGIGPVFLAFIPLLLLLKNKISNIIKILLGFSFFVITAWFFIGGHYVRFIFLVFILLAIVSAFVIDKLISYKSKIFRIFIFMVLLSSLVFNINLWVGMNHKYFPVVLGLETEDQFHDKLKDYSLYHASKFINTNTPPDTRVLLLKDNRGFFLDREFIFHSLAYTTYFDGLYEDKALLRKLNELDISYILVNHNFDSDATVKAIYTDEIEESFKNLTTKYSRKIYDRKNIEIFELK